MEDIFWKNYAFRGDFSRRKSLTKVTYTEKKLRRLLIILNTHQN